MTIHEFLISLADAGCQDTDELRAIVLPKGSGCNVDVRRAVVGPDDYGKLKGIVYVSPKDGILEYR